MWTRLKAANFYLFELFIFVRSCGLSMSAIAQNLLIQDKICLFNYGHNGSFCQNIQQAQISGAEESEKDLVLASTAQLGNYIWILHCIPMFIWTLFIGSFLDNYKGGTLLLIFLNAAGDLLAVVFYLLNTLIYSLHPTILLAVASIYWFTGGFACYTSAVYKYIVSHSGAENRAFKFMLMDVCMVLGSSLGTFLGGQLLIIRPAPDDSSPQLRTYTHNFILSIILGSTALLLLATLYGMDKYQQSLKNQSKPINSETSLLNSSTEETTNSDLNNNNTTYSDSLQVEPEERLVPKRNIIAALFNLENVRQSVATLVKRREHNARTHVFTLFIILLCHIFIFGLAGVGFQFVEKVYHWDATQFSTFSSIASILSTLTMAGMATLLVKRLHVGDGPLLIIAHLSSVFSHLIKGTFLTESAFFVATFIGSLSGFSFISIRSKFSKLVPQTEVGQIFSFIATLEAAIPIVASPAFSTLFALTIGIYPGAVFQLGAGLLVLSLTIVVWHELKLIKDELF